MIARKMVVKCRKCGRTFIRSMGGTQSAYLFGVGAPLLCDRCKYANSGGWTIVGVLMRLIRASRKK